MHGTTIHVIQTDVLGYYADENKKTDIIICLGINKLIELGVPYQRLSVSVCEGPYKRVCFIPEKDSTYYAKAELNDWRFPIRDCVDFICVGEPCVFREKEGLRYTPRDNVHYNVHYEGDEAIAKSYQHLALCYKNLLNKGIHVLQQQLKQNEDTKNIAFPMLGADFKYKNSYVSKEDTAPIAVTSVVEFLKNNSDAYNNIEFFVEEDSDFVFYKKLLMEWRGKENVLLLYFAQEDSKNIFSLLPRELIGYIAKLV